MRKFWLIGVLVILLQAPAQGTTTGLCSSHLTLVSQVLKWFVDPLALRMAKLNIRDITPRTRPRSLRGRRICDQIKEEFSPPLEPFMVHFETEPLLLGFWIAAYESFASPFVDRNEKELLAVLVSTLNGCEFCRVAHAQMECAARGGIPAAHITALERPEREAERTAIAKVFEYINRMMLVFTRRPNVLMNWMKPMVLLRVGPDARRAHEEGLSLQLLEESDPAPVTGTDLFRWAESRPNIERAFRQWHALMLEAETRLPISPELKAYLWSLVSNSGAHATVALPPEEEALRAFATQLILAPRKLVLDAAGSPLRRHFKNDVQRVEFVAWCSYLASLR